MKMKTQPTKNKPDYKDYHENMVMKYEASMKEKSKKLILKLVTLNEENRNNPDIVKEAIKLDGLALQYASEKLKNNPEIVLLAIEKNLDAFSFASKDLQNNKEFLLKILEKQPYCLQHMDEKFLNDSDIIYTSILHSKSNAFYQLASVELKKDINFVLKLVKRSEAILKHLSKEWFNNELVTLTAVQYSNTALEYFPDEIKNDFNHMLRYININPENMKYASEDLRNNIDFVRMVICRDGTQIKYASDNLKEDKSLVYSAVLNSYSALNHVDEKYKNDIDLMKIVVARSNSRNEIMNSFIGDELKANIDFINYALCVSLEYISIASFDIQNDKDYILKLMKMNPSVYEHLNSNMRGDLDVNYLAMDYNYNYLDKADKSIKNNADFLCYMLDNYCNDPISKQIVRRNIGAELSDQIKMDTWEEDLHRIKFVSDLDKKLPQKAITKTQKLKI